MISTLIDGLRRLLALAATLAVVNITSARDLPKIHVASDGEGFIAGHRKTYVPFGVTYYRPGTGWAPQVWKQFDPEATERDFASMKKLGVNCVRVFLSYGSFYHERGVLDANALAKFDEFLRIAESSGIYVHPTGPDFWEGKPAWITGDIGDEQMLQALEEFWRQFAARYRGRAVIFAYDLRNEPSVGWDDLKPQWTAWQRDQGIRVPSPIPQKNNALDNIELLKFQDFREHIADEWTRRQAAAIKASDPKALVTLGAIQWSVPSLLPGSVAYYSGFRPERQARFLDFTEVHFYPLANGGYKYDSRRALTNNLAYLESVVRAAKTPGKPLVLEEFGWYGGGQKPTFNQGAFPQASEASQAEYDRSVVETSAGIACGWLNWGFYDQPEAGDCSQQTGLVTAKGKIKTWGAEFKKLAKKLKGNAIKPRIAGKRPDLNWNACLSSIPAEKRFLDEYTADFVHSH